MRPSVMRALGTAALAGTLLFPSAALASPAAAHQRAAPQWMTYNAATKTANLTLISAYGADTYNFNGGSNGQLVVTVPLGARVVVTYSNMSAMMPHGAEVVTWTGALPTGQAPAPAFARAASPNYRHGTPKGITQTFTFTASRAGRYLLICPVRNHVKFGHWAWFIVSKTAGTATAVVK